jgi:hypothetical protein
VIHNLFKEKSARICVHHTKTEANIGSKSTYKACGVAPHFNANGF